MTREELVDLLESALETPRGREVARLLIRVASEAAGEEPAVDLDRILRAVAVETGISPEKIRGRSRVRTVWIARMVVVHVARQITTLSQAEIGAELGRNQSTIFETERSARRLLDADDRRLTDPLGRVLARLTGNGGASRLVSAGR